MRRYALLMVLLALSPFLMAESCDDWYSSDHPSTTFAGGSFQAVQLANGGFWRITFDDDSTGASSVRIRIVKNGVEFDRVTRRLGGHWEEDVGQGEVLDEIWTAHQQLLDDRGNSLLPEEQVYPLVERP